MCLKCFTIIKIVFLRTGMKITFLDLKVGLCQVLTRGSQVIIFILTARSFKLYIETHGDMDTYGKETKVLKIRHCSILFCYYIVDVFFYLSL